MYASILFSILNGQLVSETAHMSLREARDLVKAELAMHVTDEELFPKAANEILRLHLDSSLYRQQVDDIIDLLTRKYFVGDASWCTPLTGGFRNDRYGNVSPSEMRRIFYPIHGDRQDEGWSCGFRAIFSSAALHKALESGTFLSSPFINDICIKLREKEPRIDGAMAYIVLRSKLNEVITLLKHDQRTITNTLSMIQRGSRDALSMLLSIQPDYFIRRVALRLLTQDTPQVIQAIGLLGKATNRTMKEVSSQLIQLLWDARRDKAPLRNELDDALKVVGVEAKRLEEVAISKIFSSWAHEKGWAAQEIISCVLTGRPSAVRKQLALLSKQSPELRTAIDSIKRVCRALASGVSHDHLNDLVNKARNSVSQQILQLQDLICRTDHRAVALLHVIDECVYPEVQQALALFHSDDVANDEVIQILRCSREPQIVQVLARVRIEDHDRIEECLVGISGLLEACENGTLIHGKIHHQEDKSVVDFLQEVAQENAIVGKVRCPEVACVVELLQHKDQKKDIERPLREVRSFLKDIDTRQLQELFRILDGRYPEAGGSDDSFINSVRSALVNFVDPLVQEVEEILNNAQTQQEALAAREKIGKIQSIATRDALALLESDHTRDDWRVAPEYVLATPRVTGVKNTLPKMGVYADPDHLLKCANMKVLGLAPDHVHILGDFKRKGLLLDLADGISLGISDHERARIESCESDEEKSARVLQAIQKHFKEQYLDKDVTGAHHFYCNIKRPSEHWITVSLVKLKGKKPILVLLDSMNYPIANLPNSSLVGADTALCFLYNSFIRPFG